MDINLYKTIQEHIYTSYDNSLDMTFIIKDLAEDKNGDLELISTEVVGWYHGEPDETTTRLYIGKLKAEY